MAATNRRVNNGAEERAVRSKTGTPPSQANSFTPMNRSSENGSFGSTITGGAGVSGASHSGSAASTESIGSGGGIASFLRAFRLSKTS